MSFTALKNTVSSTITTNGTGAVNGVHLRTLINDTLIPALGATKFQGVATPSSDPGTPVSEVYYFATEEGIYVNFSSNIIQEEGLYVFKYSFTSNSWVRVTVFTLKTINNQSILGVGNITISGGGGSMTNSEVKTAYEANSDTNALTDARLAKLNGIQDNANNYQLPTDVVQDANYNHTDNNLTNALKSQIESSASTSYVDNEITDLDNEKQDVLVSGTNIRTINGTSILGSGDISISGGEMNVKTDWDATSGDAELLNKPDIPNIVQSTPRHNRYTPAQTTSTASSGINPAAFSFDAMECGNPANGHIVVTFGKYVDGNGAPVLTKGANILLKRMHGGKVQIASTDDSLIKSVGENAKIRDQYGVATIEFMGVEAGSGKHIYHLYGDLEA